MHIRYGYVIEIDCPQPTPLILRLDVHPDQRGDITEPDRFFALDVFNAAPVEGDTPHLDGFGNICRRLTAPQGRLRLEALGKIHHSGFADARREGARQHPPEDLPPAALPFLSGSRFCEPDLLGAVAQERFDALPSGWDKVAAITDFVHHHILFDAAADVTRTAAEVYDERVGTDRDFVHLAIALCRALAIPARFCAGYLPPIGVEPPSHPMTFANWFEAYLDDSWWVFDPRHNMPRIGRILVARGLDAEDVPVISPFGQHTIARFEITAEEVAGERYPVSSALRRESPFHIERR